MIYLPTDIQAGILMKAQLLIGEEAKVILFAVSSLPKINLVGVRNFNNSFFVKICYNRNVTLG